MFKRVNLIFSRNNKYESLQYLLINSIFLLVIAQFDKSYFGSNYSLLIIPVIIVLMIFMNYFSKSVFLFVLLIFIGSHFTFLSEFGGTFAISAFFILVFQFIQHKKLEVSSSKDKKMRFIVFVLILSTICGWIWKSQLTTLHMIFSMITFFSFLAMFFISSRIIWTEKRIQVFIITLCVVMVYALFTAIVNTKHLMPFKSTLWYSYDIEYQGVGSFFYSMIHRPTTAVGVMYFSFLIPFLLLGFKKVIFRYFKQLLLLGIISSILVCIGGFSKSHSIVLGLAVLLTPFMLFIIFKQKSVSLRKYMVLFVIGIFLYFILNPLFHFETLQKRFAEQPDLIKNFLKNPFLPKNTSRESSFAWAQESLNRENWIIGYGYANASLNRIAWFGENIVKYRGDLDFHNTYYSLPQLFGWFGSLAYLAFFLLSIIRMYKIMRNKNVAICYRILSFSFFMLILIHLVTEYSITALSSPHYLMLLFILLGLANSLFNNYKKGILFLPRNKEVYEV